MNLFDIFQPNVETPAENLIEFYEGVQNAPWKNEAPGYSREAHLGGITLTLQSNAPISWEWISAYLTGAVCWPQ